MALWKIFKKAGEPGWKCLVPFLNGHTLYKLFWKPVYYWLTLILAFVLGIALGFWSVMVGNMEVMTMQAFPMGFTAGVWLLVMVVSVLAIVWNVKLYLGMARSFGYGGGFAAGLFFLPLIFSLILAFNNDAYQGNSYVKTE